MKCQAKSETSHPPPVHTYLHVPRSGTSSSSLMNRSYLDVRSKSSRSDPVLSSSSNHHHMEATDLGGNVSEQNPLVADLSADDFMSHLGLCMVSDMTSEEPLRADDFFSLLELQSCSKQRQRKSNEPLPNGDRLRSDGFPDLNTTHDSNAAEVSMDISGTEELDNSTLPEAPPFQSSSPIPDAAAVVVAPPSEEAIIAPSSCSEEAAAPAEEATPLLIPPIAFPSQGKWMPGTKPRDIHKSGSSVEVSALKLLLMISINCHVRATK